MKTTRFNIIVAMDEENGIGKNNSIPWKLPGDLARFAAATQGAAVIMGRKTWESLPRKPLPGRLNVIISSSTEGIVIQGALTASPVVRVSSFEAALSIARDSSRPIWIIGGKRVYEDAAAHPGLMHTFVTRAPGKYGCDVFVNLPKAKDFGERGYLNLLRECIEAPSKPNRTGIDTHGVVGAQLKFNLEGDTLPMLTTKLVSFKNIVSELLWMLSGDEDIDRLHKDGVKIWDANTSESFLDSIGHTGWDEGTVGKAYGYQWRKWDNGRVDQIATVIDTLQRDPFSRRLIVTAWNPSDLGDVALPPCHNMFQFVVDSAGALHCILNMRSADLGLGVPYNCASYSLLTHMVASLCGRKAASLTINIGDAHVYANHIEGLREQLTREPLSPPLLRIATQRGCIDDFVAGDLKLIQYHHHPAIALEMAV